MRKLGPVPSPYWPRWDCGAVCDTVCSGIFWVFLNVSRCASGAQLSWTPWPYRYRGGVKKKTPSKMLPGSTCWLKDVSNLVEEVNFSQKHEVINVGPKLTSFGLKPDVTNTGPHLTSFGPKMWCYQHRAPTDLLWSKNVMLSTQAPLR